MSTRTTAAFVTAALVCTASAQAQNIPPIRDPIRDYLNHFETQPGEQLISTEVDLNRDNIPEIFLSRTSLYNGRQGNVWVLYESLPEGLWRRHETLNDSHGGVIEFHPKAVSAQPDGNGGKLLIRYSPGSARSGQLTTFQLRKGGVSESIRQEIQPTEGDAGLFERYFNTPQTQLSFQLRSMDELRAQYLPFNGWFHEITIGKLIFLALCALVPLWILRTALGILFRRKKEER